MTPRSTAFPATAISDLCPVKDTPGCSLEEVAHQIRQPLSVIESLAYYLELLSCDESTASHLRRIQAMVLQANMILCNACEHTPSAHH